MKKLLFPIALLTSLSFCSCNKERTPYEIKYRFDNTEIQSEYFKVFEYNQDGTLNQKWRGDFHHYDTVMENGQERVYAYGTIKDVAREGCTALSVSIDGVVNNLHCWTLDTLFQLNLGEENLFEITPDMQWKDTWE